MPYLNHRKITVRSDKHDSQERRNDKWSRYYQDRRWKKLRHWQITNFPLCYDCLFEGRSVPAEHVHHIRPFGDGETDEDRFALLLDPDNLVSLCHLCHAKRHKQLNSQN